MPEKKTAQRARRALRQGKRPTTAAGEFVHEEIDHVRKGKHGARSTRQAIAIGLSKARRAGVPLPPPDEGQASSRTRRSAQRDLAAARKGGAKKTSPRRSRASTGALKREGRAAGSRRSLSRQAKQASRRRRRGARSRR